jgi:hypothetical protein
VTRARVRLAAAIGAACAAAVASVVAWWTAVVAARWARAGAHAARFALRLVTLRAYRRCPACFRVLRREAVVCRSCGAARR